MKQSEQMKKRVLDRLVTLHITPDKSLGQHFLISEDAISLLERSVTKGALVIEIGAGVGQVTEVLAKQAAQVISFEIDTRYKSVLDEVKRKYTNVEILYQSALGFNYHSLLKRFQTQKIQIIASLPYHITEPFISEIIHIPVDEMILITGMNFSDIVFADLNSSNTKFSLLTLLVHTFFDVTLEKTLERNDFFPQPRTKSAVLKFTPHAEAFFHNQVNFLLKRLYMTSHYGGLIKNVCMESFIAFANKQNIVQSFANSIPTKNQARALVAKLNLSEEILHKSFSQLSNDEIRKLAQALKTYENTTL